MLASVGHIAPLRGPGNYRAWKSQGLWTGVIEGDGKPTPEQDAKTRHLIAQTVEDHLLPDIESPESSKVAWQKLQDMYMAASQARRHDLDRDLSNLTKLKDETVQQFVSRARQLTFELKAAGDPINDEKVLAYIVNGMKRSKAFEPITSMAEITADITSTSLTLELSLPLP